MASQRAAACESAFKSFCSRAGAGVPGPSRSMRSICCRRVFFPPASTRVLVAVGASAARTSESSAPASRKSARSLRPISSLPTTPMGSTCAPRAQRLATALAAQPGFSSADS